MRSSVWLLVSCIVGCAGGSDGDATPVDAHTVGDIHVSDTGVIADDVADVLPTDVGDATAETDAVDVEDAPDSVETEVIPPDPQWWEVPLGSTGGEIHRARHIDDLGFRLVGSDGAILRPIGAGFVREHTPWAVATLHDVAGSAATGVHAVGSAGGWLQRTDDGSWTGWDEAPDAELYSATVVADAVVAVGADGTAVRRIGDVLTWEASDGASLRAVATSGEEAFAVGDGGTVRRRVLTDGVAKWVDDAGAGAEVDLHDVFVLSPSNLWVVGGNGTVLHFTGGWALESTGTARALRGVSGTAGQVVSVGEGGTFIQRGDAGQWAAATDVDGPLLAHFDYRSVAMAGDRAVAVGAAGAMQTKALPDGHWIDPPASALTLTAMDSGTDQLIGVGASGLIVRIDGGGRGAIDSGTDAHLHDVLIADDGVAWAVGDGGTVVAVVPDEVPVVTSAGTGSLVGVAPSGDGVTALGETGLLYSLTASGGTETGWVGHAGLYTGMGSDGSWRIAFGDGGRLLIESGTGWNPVPLSLPGTLRAMDSRDGRALVVGDGGTVVAWSVGTPPTLETPEPAAAWRDVAIGPDGAAWLVGWAGRIHHRSADGTYEARESPTLLPLGAVELFEGQPVMGGQAPAIWMWREALP